jgi:hypothetical protein
MSIVFDIRSLQNRGSDVLIEWRRSIFGIDILFKGFLLFFGD